MLSHDRNCRRVLFQRKKKRRIWLGMISTWASFRHQLTVPARNSIALVTRITCAVKSSWRVSTSSISVTVVHVCHAFVDWNNNKQQQQRTITMNNNNNNNHNNNHNKTRKTTTKARTRKRRRKKEKLTGNFLNFRMMIAKSLWPMRNLGILYHYNSLIFVYFRCKWIPSFWPHMFPLLSASTGAVAFKSTSWNDVFMAEHRQQRLEKHATWQSYNALREGRRLQSFTGLSLVPEEATKPVVFGVDWLAPWRHFMHTAEVVTPDDRHGACKCYVTTQQPA